MTFKPLLQPGKTYPSERWCQRCNAYTPCTTTQVGTVDIEHASKTARVFELGPCQVCEAKAAARRKAEGYVDF